MVDQKKSEYEADEPPMVTPEASLAADDPTAVWDSDELREAGLPEVFDDSNSSPPPPATPGVGQSAPSIVAQDAAQPEAAAQGRPPAQARASKELSWGATFALALGLGAAVYVTVRFLL